VDFLKSMALVQALTRLYRSQKWNVSEQVEDIRHVCVSHPEGVEKLSSLKEMETFSWLAFGVHSESVVCRLSCLG